MLTITRGTINTIILTLTEKVSIGQPVCFLFEFINDQTRQAYYLIATDQSGFTYRYNEFHIIEKSEPDTLNGEISLPTPGDYHYTLYQQSSDTNLDPENALGILETGKLVVLEAGYGNDNIVYNAGDEENVVYGV